MPPTNASEEIIEKKAGSPVATSCLIIAMIALLGAIVFQVMELAEYRRGVLAYDKDPDPAKKKADLDIKKFRADFTAIIEKKVAGEGIDAGGALDGDKPEDGEADAGKAAGTDEKTDEKTVEKADNAAKGDAGADEKAEEKAGEADEKAGEAGAAGDADDAGNEK